MAFAVSLKQVFLSRVLQELRLTLQIFESGQLRGLKRALVIGLCVLPQPVHGQLSKGYQILLNRGLQVQGMITDGDVFHLSTYSNANFTTMNWLWTSNPSLMGPAPGFPWARWVQDETNMPGPPRWNNETPYLNQLVALQLGDEWDLNTDSVRTRLVNWFNAVRANWPNTLLYHNNWAGQIPDGPLSDFISRAQPDMLCFDGYPWQSDYNTGVPLSWNMPNSLVTGWYGELRRYRAWGLTYHIPYGIYRDTFHATQAYNQTTYRDPSPSELRLNTSAALAFNAKAFINFTYNTGASSLFSSPGGDSYPNALYFEQVDVNRRAMNLGKALVCLTPIYDLHNQNDTNPPPGQASSDPCVCFQDGYCTSVMFLRGKYIYGGTTNFTDLPNSFLNDQQALTANPANPNSIGYSWWEFQKNDPYWTGWVVTNKASVVNNGLPGEVIVAWFRPLDESFDGPNYTNEIYFMVVNALTATNGTAADCMQEIKMNFISSVPSAVVMLDPETGTLQTNTMPIIPSSGGRRQLVLDLNGGDAALFKFDDGAPFVGYVTPSAAQLSLSKQGSAPVISLVGTVGARYQIQSAPALPAPVWTGLTNVLLPESPWLFLDQGASNRSAGFYRAVGMP